MHTSVCVSIAMSLIVIDKSRAYPTRMHNEDDIDARDAAPVCDSNMLHAVAADSEDQVPVYQTTSNTKYKMQYKLFCTVYQAAALVSVFPFFLCGYMIRPI